ncbi:hypothetical protein [Thauera humireducens]|uniref:hypothetical protein n=1 Tax=Thauera humireducens TaxID=1134435 RepID=UPI00311E4E73
MRALLPLLIIATLPQAAPASPTPTEAPQRNAGAVARQPRAHRGEGQGLELSLCVGKQGGDDVLATPGNALGNCRDQAWSKKVPTRITARYADAKGSIVTVEGRFAGDFQYNFQDDQHVLRAGR